MAPPLLLDDDGEANSVSLNKYTTLLSILLEYHYYDCGKQNSSPHLHVYIGSGFDRNVTICGDRRGFTNLYHHHTHHVNTLLYTINMYQHFQ